MISLPSRQRPWLVLIWPVVAALVYLIGSEHGRQLLAQAWHAVVGP